MAWPTYRRNSTAYPCFCFKSERYGVQRVIKVLPCIRGYLSVTQMNVMKAIVTLLFILTLGAYALANTGEKHVKVNPIKVGLILDLGTDSAEDTKKAASDSDKKIVRLYRRKNTLVKKALRFSTKRTRAKLA